MADPFTIQSGNQENANGVIAPARGGRTGEQMVSLLHNSRYETGYRGKYFYALATAQTLSVAGTAMTGLILWNGSPLVNLALDRVQLIVSVTSASMTGIGLGSTAVGAQTSAPTTTTAITASGSTFLGASTSAATAYTIGTTLAVATRASLLHNTAAINTVGLDSFQVDIAGFVIPPYTAVALTALGAASAASAVTATLFWEEIPV